MDLEDDPRAPEGELLEVTTTDACSCRGLFQNVTLQLFSHTNSNVTLYENT